MKNKFPSLFYAFLFLLRFKPNTDEGDEEERPSETNEMADRLLQVREKVKVDIEAIMMLELN